MAVNDLKLNCKSSYIKPWATKYFCNKKKHQPPPPLAVLLLLVKSCTTNLKKKHLEYYMEKNLQLIAIWKIPRDPLKNTRTLNTHRLSLRLHMSVFIFAALLHCFLFAKLESMSLWAKQTNTTKILKKEMTGKRSHMTCWCLPWASFEDSKFTSKIVHVDTFQKIFFKCSDPWRTQKWWWWWWCRHCCLFLNDH